MEQDPKVEKCRSTINNENHFSPKKKKKEYIKYIECKHVINGQRYKREQNRKKMEIG